VADKCLCAQNGTMIGAVPYYTTDHPFDGPPTVPPRDDPDAACCTDPEAELSNCTTALTSSGEPVCHAETYEYAKPFDPAYWANNYSTPLLCVLRPNSTIATTIHEHKDMHDACQRDGDHHADGVCQQGRKDIEADGTRILHCGQCSSCSTLHDLNVYNRSRLYITDQVADCSTNFTIDRDSSEADLISCLQAKGIDFSQDPAMAWADPANKPSCMDTWLDDIINDGFVCTKDCLSRLRETNNTGVFSRDKCLQCDEYSSGPAFIKGAGANRRSSGLISDIDRSELDGTPWEQDICKVGYFSPR